MRQTTSFLILTCLLSCHSLLPAADPISADLARATCCTQKAKGHWVTMARRPSMVRTPPISVSCGWQMLSNPDFVRP